MSAPFWDLPNGITGADLQVDPWDRCKLQGNDLPGIVEVLVNSKQRRLQNRKQNGSDGRTPTFRGMDPAKVTIRVVIWTPTQFAKWDAILPVIFPNPNKDVNKLSALDISSPATDHRHVASIIIEDIEGPKPGPVHGSKEWTLKCVEYLPVAGSKSAVKTVESSVPTTAAFVAPSATKNSPPAPSTTDFGPTPKATPQQGAT